MVIGLILGSVAICCGDIFAIEERDNMFCAGMNSLNNSVGCKGLQLLQFELLCFLSYSTCLINENTCVNVYAPYVHTFIYPHACL